MSGFLDAYLQITGPAITGECKDKVMKGQIQLISFKFGWSSTKSVVPPEILAELEKAGDSKAAAKLKKGGNSDAIKKAIEKLKNQSVETERPNDDQLFTFSASKFPDSSSPMLFKAFASTRRPELTETFKEAVVTLRKTGFQNTGPSLFINFRFGQVTVTGYKFSAKGSNPSEEDLTFAFQTCKMQYTPQMADGGRSSPNIKGWNFKDNKAM